MATNKFNESIIKGMQSDDKFIPRLALLLTNEQLHQLVEGVPLNWKPNIEKIKKQFPTWQNVAITEIRETRMTVGGIAPQNYYFTTQEEADNALLHHTTKGGSTWQHDNYTHKITVNKEKSINLDIANPAYSDIEIF